MKRINPVPPVFVLLCLAGWHFSGMTPAFLAGEVITRFIRDGVLVISLLIPIMAGMGLNFAITIGAICAQTGFLLMLDRRMDGVMGIALAALVGSILSIFFGWIIARILNRVKGREMITTIIIGFLGTSLYQLVFLVGYGTLLPVGNPEIVLSRGMGVRSMVDLVPYRNLLDRILLISLGGIDFPLLMIGLVLSCALSVAFIRRTRMGAHFEAVSLDWQKAELLGIDVDRVRTRAVILSTVIACLGQILYLENIGMLNVYTAHLNSDIFSCAALLAGGATVSNARIRHVFWGIGLFHCLFIVSPQAGQNLAQNAALGEYFRSFVAYGTIAFALVMNLRREK
jgi:simple sugar transport system permease protein